MKAEGTFTVEMKPLDISVEGKDEIQLGRFGLIKVFSGDLNASSKGEMTSARTTVATSAGYVAIEQVHGQLNGKTGSFVLQHSGIMSELGKKLTIEIVPNSGSKGMVGISGSMTIDMQEGQHIYSLDYQLP